MESEELLAGFLQALRSKNLWFNFDTGEIISDADLRLMLQENHIQLENISSEPDIFPVYGNLDDAVGIHLPSLVAYVRSQKKIPKKTPMSPRMAKTAAKTRRPPVVAKLPQRAVGIDHPGRLALYPAVYGFRNPSNYCFMDSTLIGMFAFQDSPFYENLVQRPFVYNPGRFFVCGDNRETDQRVRTQIRETLATDVLHLITGTSGHVCTDLRRLVGRVCRPTREIFDPKTKKTRRIPSGTDMSAGMHDPGELYARLMQAMDYSPIDTYKYYEFKVVDRWVRGSRIHEDSEAFLSLNIGDVVLTRIRWPNTWDGYIGEVEKFKPDPEVLQSLRAEGESAEAIAGIRALEGKTDLQKRERMFIRRADVFVVNINRRDHKRGDTAVNTRRIEVDHILDVPIEGGPVKRFVLQAVVYPPGEGHYQCLLKNGNTWYDYNDLSAREVVLERQITLEKAQDLIDTRGVLLFYY